MREMQIKATMRYHFSQVISHFSEWPLFKKKKNPQITNTAEAKEKREPSYTVGECV